MIYLTGDTHGKFRRLLNFCDRIETTRRKNMSKGKGCSGNTHTQAQMNHHANQSNPNNAAHTAAMNNHANQCNPNHSASKGK